MSLSNCVTPLLRCLQSSVNQNCLGGLSSGTTARSTGDSQLMPSMWSGKDFLDSCVSRRWQNVANDSADVKASGRSFQFCGLATGKAQLPTVDGMLIGTTRQWSKQSTSILSCQKSLLLHLKHWLKVPERIQFKLAVLVYKCLHEPAPSYLTDQIQLQPADLGIRSCLWSAVTSSLPVRCTWLSTVGDRSFLIAAARTWNALPCHVTSAPLYQFLLAAWRPTYWGVHSIDFCSACV